MLEHHFVRALLVRKGLKLQVVHAVKQYESLEAFPEPRSASGRQALYISRLTIDLAFRCGTLILSVMLMDRETLMEFSRNPELTSKRVVIPVVTVSCAVFEYSLQANLSLIQLKKPSELRNHDFYSTS